jgi:soluble lytic murein transglycosylase-like protein
MKIEKKNRIQIAALSCVAAFSTAAGASAAVMEPPEAEIDSKPKPEQQALAVPKPVNGAIEGVSLATLNSIAACESGGDPTAVNDAGYYGKYQFDESTWASVGGSGNPAEASEAEQDYRAALLYSRAGSSPWPVCGS